MNDRKGQNVLAIEHQNGKYIRKKIDVLNMMTIFATFEKFGSIWGNRANEMPYLVTSLSDLNLLKFIQKMGVDCCEEFHFRLLEEEIKI
ncbi:hypothetical protein T4B_12285 [Trichinella pseudospiralis]|uniref:Uncharacterized protein n=2 Tax=Trichinella pseudospiralis TaxID=6337 RepID=A0A0V1JDD5_TRIPS|nr:hypothetical protein T4D_4510 [Trichinella pseudospiralis]KRZ32893.1 hypothetical protein T4B_12285 [Trichinella pseudospiralis]